ncbi:hypothetical protein ACJX0J_008428, partial [Zea mays]
NHRDSFTVMMELIHLLWQDNHINLFTVSLSAASSIIHPMRVEDTTEQILLEYDPNSNVSLKITSFASQCSSVKTFSFEHKHMQLCINTDPTCMFSQGTVAYTTEHVQFMLKKSH